MVKNLTFVYSLLEFQNTFQVNEASSFQINEAKNFEKL